MTARHQIRGVISPDAVQPRATQPPIAEFVKRWAPGDGGTAVTLRLQAEVRWHARQPEDLEPEERAEFDAAVVAGMRQMAVALGVTTLAAGGACPAALAGADAAAAADTASFAPQDVARPAAMSPPASPFPSLFPSLPKRGVAP